MPYLEPDSDIDLKRTEKFDEGYLEGKRMAKVDLLEKCVDISWFKMNRRINNPYEMGIEVGYLRQLLWTLTEGKIK